MKIFRRLKLKNGLSFIEVMTTAAILSFGIVMIYRAFFTALNYYNHVAYRLGALLHIQNKITLIQKDLEVSHYIRLNQGKQLYQTTINHHPVNFELYVEVDALPEAIGVYELRITASWHEGARAISLSRQTYIYHIRDENNV